jgi:hypothetical protein
MKYFTSLFLASLVTLAIAQDADNIGDKMGRKDGKKNRDLTSDEKTCRRMWNVNRAQQIASNQTRMDMIAKKDPARATRIKDIATKDGPQLKELQKNSTLTNFCDTYQASERQKRQCSHVKNLDKLQKKLNDKNAVEDAAKKNNATPDEVRKRWQHDIDVAQKQKGNKTFTDACAKMKDSKQNKG